MARSKQKKENRKPVLANGGTTSPQAENLNGGEISKAKAKTAQLDDFVMTISDSDADVPDFDEDDDGDVAFVAEGGEKKVEPESKRGKKRKRETQRSEEEEKKKGNDGGLNSDFEFKTGDLGESVEELEGWGFEGAKNAMKDGKKGVDIEEIIRRRKRGKEDREAECTEEVDKGSEGDLEDNEEVEEEENGGQEEFQGFDEDDEDVAEDGFGMGADSEDEEDGGMEANLDVDLDGKDSNASDASNGDDGEDTDSSVAEEVSHPDDEVSSEEEEEQETAEEAARKAAYFASESESFSSSSVTLSFQSMNLSRPILRGLANVGFITPTMIQQRTIPVALLGKDIVGGAVTGSGKTAAFIVPILERLLYRPKKIPTSRVVILCPTRELAMQCHSVAVKLAAFTDIKFALAVGGLSLKVQEAGLKLRPDVIIATPGRFIDHMRNSSGFSVDSIEIIVMDEADRMLEDGFADELNEIVNTIPKSRQTMLFSATMTDSVDKLIRLSLQRPVRIMVDNKKSTVKTLVQEFVRIRPQREPYRLAMLLLLCKEHFTQRTIVFFRSKAFAHRVRIVFGLFGLKAAELHGSLSQEQRVKAVETFRDGKADFLLATDLASRGLDIKNVDVVINYEVPQSHEIYLHRVGRTARAGRQGRSITLAAEPDRKIVKSAIKAAQEQSAKVVSRVLDTAKVDSLHGKIEALDSEIDEILKEEKEEKQLQSAEMQLKKGENLIKYEDEIRARPKRTWFETQEEKKQQEKISKAALNGVVLPEKKGKISGKKRKKLEGREEREEGKTYKKTKGDRGSKILKGKAAKKAVSVKKGGKSKGKGKGKGRK